MISTNAHSSTQAVQPLRSLMTDSRCNCLQARLQPRGCLWVPLCPSRRGGARFWKTRSVPPPIYNTSSYKYPIHCALTGPSSRAVAMGAALSAVKEETRLQTANKRGGPSLSVRGVGGSTGNSPAKGAAPEAEVRACLCALCVHVCVCLRLLHFCGTCLV